MKGGQLAFDVVMISMRRFDFQRWPVWTKASHVMLADLSAYQAPAESMSFATLHKRIFKNSAKGEPRQ